MLLRTTEPIHSLVAVCSTCSVFPQTLPVPTCSWARVVLLLRLHVAAIRCARCDPSRPRLDVDLAARAEIDPIVRKTTHAQRPLGNARVVCISTACGGEDRRCQANVLGSRCSEGALRQSSDELCGNAKRPPRAGPIAGWVSRNVSPPASGRREPGTRGLSGCPG